MFDWKDWERLFEVFVHSCNHENYVGSPYAVVGGLEGRVMLMVISGHGDGDGENLH